MYATAQRVRSRQNQIGINAFLHQHGESKVEGIDWDNIDLSFITEKATGVLVSENTEVAPGGNSVLSYLDVVCPDETPLEEVQEVVKRAREDLHANRPPLDRTYNRIAVRFGAAFGLRGAEGVEYDALADALLNILRQRASPVWMGKAPLQVEVNHTEAGLTFQLAEDAAAEARVGQEVSLPLGVVRIDYDTLGTFERLHGDLMMHILPTITGLSLEKLRSEGGVQVVEAKTGGIVWEWPRRSTTY